MQSRRDVHRAEFARQIDALFPVLARMDPQFRQYLGAQISIRSYG